MTTMPSVQLVSGVPVPRKPVPSELSFARMDEPMHADGLVPGARLSP